MTSQLGYLPKEMKSLANGIQVPTDGTVTYAAPVGFHKALVASGATTLTAAQCLGGLIIMDPDGGNTLTLPSAADLVSAANGLAVGSTLRLTVINTAGAGSENITVAEGTGITNYTDGTVTSILVVGSNASAEFIINFTNVDPGDEAATLYMVNLSAAVNST